MTAAGNSTTASTITPVSSGTAGASSATATQTPAVPPAAQEKYPEIVALILQSQSMNAEERNYWLQVLPVMTESQVAELKDILEGEQKKLQAIDAKYAGKKEDAPQIDPAEIEKRRKAARLERQKAEIAAQKAEEAAEAQLLAQLATMEQ